MNWLKPFSHYVQSVATFISLSFCSTLNPVLEHTRMYISPCSSASVETFMPQVSGFRKKLWLSCGTSIAKTSSWKQKYMYSLQGGTIGVFHFNPWKTHRLKFQLLPRNEGFRFVVLLNAFTTIWCNKAGSVSRFKGLYSASRTAVTG